jgi:hypothetical protein
MSPLEDLCRTRTSRDRKGTIPDKWNDVLLRRDLERLIGEGLVTPVTSVREIPADFREKIWYEEVGTGNLYVYVAAWERGSPEFRRHAVSPKDGTRSIQ